MKTFWQKNKLLLAIFIFTATLSSYLYTTLYTSEEKTSVMQYENILTQPSKEYRGNDVIITKSIDTSIQNKPLDVSKKPSEDFENSNLPPDTLQPSTETNTSTIETAKEIQSLVDVRFEVPLIDYHGGEFRVKHGSTVYDAMNILQHVDGLAFTGKKYGSLGFFVESIGGIKNSTKTGEYWIYYINSNKAQVGISNYILQPNDIITWNYETDETR